MKKLFATLALIPLVPICIVILTLDYLSSNILELATYLFGVVNGTTDKATILE